MNLNTLVLLANLIIGMISFGFGFYLVFKSLKKINLVENEKFNVEDWMSCVIFGLMFSAAILFLINISLDVIIEETISTIASFLLLLMIGILIVYPLWEVFFLGRPTSDSVHDLHKLIETKILDRFEGKKAYLMSFVVFLVMYIVPVFILDAFLHFGLLEVGFVWFLLFPLFFLNYFAASGQIAGILSADYQHRHFLDPKEKKNIPKNQQNIVEMVKHAIFIGIAWLPFLLAFYNIYNPIAKTLSGASLEPKDNILSAYLSLFTTVVFGIKGFFDRFWSKKSKTKTIDFVFSGYIFIAIGINALINFFIIDPDLINSVLSLSIGNFQPLNPIKNIFSNAEILIPLLTVQSVVMVVYGIKIILDRNSDFHADIRLSAVNHAYGLELVDEVEGKKKKSEKEKQYDLPTLIKSTLLSPVYNKFGLDVNTTVRKKAAQNLYLISLENEENAKVIINTVAQNTIEAKNMLFVSKEGVDLLGDLGAKYPHLITERLVTALETANLQVQQYILDALGDVGEVEENLDVVLDRIKSLLIDERYELRIAANNAIVEMVLDGDFQNKEFVQKALSVVYNVLDKYPEEEQYLDNALEAILRLCAKIPREIDIQKIIPFLNYNDDGRQSKEISDFIIQNTVNIIGYIVYYNIDTFPFDKIVEKCDDNRNFVRYVAMDALGNYSLKGPDGPKDQIIQILMNGALNDPDPDVREMCDESIAEFLIMNKDFRQKSIEMKGETTTIFEYFANNLESESSEIAENASEALKFIAPIYKENTYALFSKYISGDNLEVSRDLMHTLGLLDAEIHKQVDLNLLYSNLAHKDGSVRAFAIFALGMIAQNRPNDIDATKIIPFLEDEDPTVRLEAIFALGKIGSVQPEKVTEELIRRFFKLDKADINNISETELYAESLGVIGAKNPSSEIIISLQQALMGDCNVFAKDVVAKAMYSIGEGMIKSGNAKRLIENEAFYNQVSWLTSLEKKEYTPGNLIIMLIEALQQKGIPDIVMNEISDSMQDLLPVFLFLKTTNQKQKDVVLNTIKGLLSQAYYSNYNQEILETMDRIDSLINFRKYFELNDSALKEQALFFALQLTPDGKQFHDQGEIFMLFKEQDQLFLDYALKSFEISIDLSPNEYYSPNAIFRMGEIYLLKGNKNAAKEKFLEALDIFASLDEIESMRECEEYLAQLD